MTTAKDLQKQFHCCMPLFIALGDKVRLSIVELLSEDALKNGGTRGTIDFEGCAMNVNEITRRTSLSRPAISHHLKNIKRCRSGGCTPGRDSQLLLSHLT